ncbi:MAG: XRE family transcriptional regulator [Oscillospiraceae bacterium]|nr:XRE family transcriptional regulator [Oscillospiraceae bacterium]
MELNIGDKIKSLRLQNSLTQKELADRCELSKGFISQLESNQTSPSLSTLEDILVTLGSSFREFFAGEAAEKPVFRKEDVFIKEAPESGAVIHWLIPNAQKKDMEPILLVLAPGGRSEIDLPHTGEEFGYVLTGSVLLTLGERTYKVRKGDSFSYKPDARHWLANSGKTEAGVLWVSTPPNF